MMPSDLDAPALSVDPADAVGCSYHCADRYVVGREKIREFARAVQDSHQAHWSESAAGQLGCPGLVAPPTFTSVPAFLAQIAMFDHVAHGYDMSQIMQTDYVVAFGKPVVAGDELTLAVHFESFRRAFGGDIFRFRCEAVDGHGELCLTTWTTFVGRPDVDASAARACEHVMMQNVRQAAPGRRAHAPAEAPRAPRAPPSPENAFRSTRSRSVTNFPRAQSLSPRVIWSTTPASRATRTPSTGIAMPPRRRG